MKAVALVALLVVSANAASQTFNNAVTGSANLGYPNPVSTAKAGGDSLWGAFPIPASPVRPDLVPNDGYSACLIVTATLTSKLADSVASFCAAAYGPGTAFPNGPADPTTNTLACSNLFQLSKSSSGLTMTGVFDWTPQQNGTTGVYTWPTGVLVGATTTKCTTCASTADWSVTALVAYNYYYCTSSSTMHVAPVVAIDSSNTWTWTGLQTGYQYQQQMSPAYVMVDPAKQNSLPIFALATPDTTGSMHISYFVLPIPGPATPQLSNTYPTMSNFPSDPSSQQASAQNTVTGPLVAPLGNAKTGSFRTGSVSLSQPASGNAWFIAPYIDSGASWTLAIGYGHEPSSAIAAAPSLLLAAIFAVIAMLL